MNLYSLLELHPDIFDDVKIADGIDYVTAINSILDSCGIYHFRNHEYPFCKKLITSWFKRWYNAFERINNALSLEYDLVQNYDRNQSYSRTVQRDNNYDNNLVNTNNTDSETTGKVSAFNESTFQNSTQDTTKDVVSVNENTTHNETGNEIEIINNHEYGDIGVDTTANKIIAELNFRRDKSYNIYYIISNLFFEEFMIRLL